MTVDAAVALWHRGHIRGHSVKAGRHLLENARATAAAAAADAAPGTAGERTRARPSIDFRASSSRRTASVDADGPSRQRREWHHRRRKRWARRTFVRSLVPRSRRHVHGQRGSGKRTLHHVNAGVTPIQRSVRALTVASRASAERRFSRFPVASVPPRGARACISLAATTETAAVRTDSPRARARPPPTTRSSRTCDRKKARRTRAQQSISSVKHDRWLVIRRRSEWPTHRRRCSSDLHRTQYGLGTLPSQVSVRSAVAAIASHSPRTLQLQGTVVIFTRFRVGGGACARGWPRTQRNGRRSSFPVNVVACTGATTARG